MRQSENMCSRQGVIWSVISNKTFTFKSNFKPSENTWDKETIKWYHQEARAWKQWENKEKLFDINKDLRDITKCNTLILLVS